MRNKFMSNEEAKPIFQHSGLPVELSGAIPSCFQNLPAQSRIYMSGMKTPNGDWLGAVICRDASHHPEASSGFVVNQDLYSGYYGTSGYVICGPFYDANHWATGIPQRLSNAPVIDRENKTE